MFPALSSQLAVFRGKTLATLWFQRSHFTTTMFEIEKKFKLTSDIEERVVEHGGEFVKEIHFTDTYYDFPRDYTLTVRDIWLRQRQNLQELKPRWELKIPLVLGDAESRVSIDRYKEITDEQEIAKKLFSFASDSRERINDLDLSMHQASESLHLTHIAKFNTVRKKYKFAGGLTIDLDSASFGYELGEIEVMCENEDDVSKATNDILELANKLGVTIQDSVTGKVGTYLKMNNKHHYHLLVNAHVLSNPE